MTEIAPNLPEPLILISPDTLPRTPVFQGTRIPFQALFDCFEGGDSLAELLQDFPAGSRRHAIAVLEWAGTSAAWKAAAATDPPPLER